MIQVDKQAKVCMDQVVVEVGTRLQLQLRAWTLPLFIRFPNRLSQIGRDRLTTSYLAPIVG